MVDRFSNAPAWASHAGDIVVFPVGALEQHGAHLPVDTDIRNAEYTANAIAAHFDAALLPALPIGNSLEHGGFRGAFTLRPDTLMTVLRDIAEDAEGQEFRFLIVVSGHGGNFALGPACREWNRSDRKLKILLVFPAEFCDASECEASRRHVMDIHAGEIETSRFLAMGGVLTGPLPDGPEMTKSTVPWRRQDLNSFGVGYLNPQGFLGMPQYADRAKGERLLDEMHRNIFAYLDDRINQLRRQPNYGGARE